jgi:glucose-6-phosphate dehydrogenase assembly protein OpcA
LKVEVIREISSGPGMTAARMTTASGDIAITRPDGLLASYAVPGQPERLVALKRRNLTELISEELRRMDPDEVYERTAKSLLEGGKRTTAKARTKKAGAKKSDGKNADSTRRVAKQTAGSR